MVCRVETNGSWVVEGRGCQEPLLYPGGAVGVGQSLHSEGVLALGRLQRVTATCRKADPELL